MSLTQLVTIGAFGFTESSFFGALQEARVDTFCDIRWRRGVRGAEYAFVNSTRLQAKLAALGIRYLHLHDLAPKPELRRLQTDADQAQGVAKRKRAALGEVFIEAYRKRHLASFDAAGFVKQIGDARVAALFCVERSPAACHRSLLAERLRQDLGLPVIHLLPKEAAA